MTFTCPPEHRHDTSSTCYIQHRCRCLPCRAGNTARAARRAKLKAYGRWDRGLVDAEPIRTHLRHLQANGYGYKRIAALSGVSLTGVRDLLYGRQDPGPRHGEIAKHCTREKADRLLAVTVDFATIADGAKVSARGTHRRLQALVTVGWSQAKLAEHLGLSPANFGKMLRQEQVLARLHRRVAALYDQLWDQTPPLHTPADRAAYSRARRHATDAGWMPPLAWDNPDTDPAPAEPDEEDVVDDLAVQLVLDGHQLQLTRPDRQAVVAHLTHHGHSAADIATRLGVTARTVVRDRAAAGITTDQEEVA